MPTIQNVSRIDIRTGEHLFTGRDILIQISDPPADPPTPLLAFHAVHPFWFDDIETEEGTHCEQGITPEQAAEIASILRNALIEGRNVIVHCNAGLSRSGAVAQAGEAIGFASGGRNQSPNERVLRLITER
jgi:predicted protein tyrosine phosphatase